MSRKNVSRKAGLLLPCFSRLAFSLAMTAEVYHRDNGTLLLQFQAGSLLRIIHLELWVGPTGPGVSALTCGTCLPGSILRKRSLSPARRAWNCRRRHLKYSGVAAVSPVPSSSPRPSTLRDVLFAYKRSAAHCSNRKAIAPRVRLRSR